MKTIQKLQILGILSIILLPALFASCTSKSNNPSSPAVPTNTPTPVITGTPTNSATTTATGTPTGTATKSATPTATKTPTSSATASPSGTPTNTATLTLTATITNSPTLTPTSSLTGTPTNSATQTPTATITNTPTRTVTSGPTNSGNVSTLTISNPSGLVYPTGVAVDSSQNIYAASGAEDVDEVLSGTGLVNLIGGQSYTAGPGYNGPATLITMNNPQGIGVDSFGNVYVADTANNMIREITVSTSPVSMIVFAGQETAGYVDATGVAAQFSQPWGIAVDKSNNVYVGDTGNGVIRIISPSGAVTTFAGKSYGSAITLTNGPASIASFNGTDGIALDNNGNFYVTETGYEDVRKITISGGTTMVSTLAGSGVAAFNNANGILAEFNSPIGVAVDSSGNVYVADQNNQLIRKITPGGDVSTLAGQTSSHGSSNGQGSAASFYNPQGLAIDQNGILYVGDAQNNLIRIIQ